MVTIIRFGKKEKSIINLIKSAGQISKNELIIKSKSILIWKSQIYKIINSLIEKGILEEKNSMYRILELKKKETNINPGSRKQVVSYLNNLFKSNSFPAEKNKLNEPVVFIYVQVDLYKLFSEKVKLQEEGKNLPEEEIKEIFHLTFENIQYLFNRFKNWTNGKFYLFYDDKLKRFSLMVDKSKINVSIQKKEIAKVSDNKRMELVEAIAAFIRIFEEVKSALGIENN